MNVRMLRATCLAAVSVLLSASGLAQAVNGSLLGTVADKTGATIANAKVTIKEISTNILHDATTNTSGNYSF